MEIDPKKIDFSKMKPYQDLEKNDEENAGEKISGGFSGYKNNLSGDKENQQKYNEAEKNNIFNNEKLMSVLGLLSLSWKMFKERWKKLIGLTLLSIVVGVAIEIISIILQMFGNGFLLFTILEIIITLIFYIPGMLIGIAIIEVMRDKNLGIFEAIKGAAGKLLSFFVTMLVGTLAMVAVLIINMIVVIAGFLMFAFILSFTASSLSSGGVLIALINVIIWLLGFVVILLMLLPTFIASIWLYFAQFAVVLEKMSPVESLSYSYELMKKKMLSIVWKNIAVAILLIIASALMLIAVLIPSMIIPFLMVIAAIAMIPVVLAVIFIVFPVMYLFQYNIYENLKAIKKDELPPDYAVKHKVKIKILAVLGALIIASFILFSVLASSLFNNLENKFIDTPYGSYFQNESGKKDYSSKESENNKTLSEIEKRDEQRISDLDSISLMLWHYKEQIGNYPISDSAINLNENNNLTSEIKSANIGEEISRDPLEKYFYDYKSDGETYELSAVLENKNDARCQTVNNFCVYKKESVENIFSSSEVFSGFQFALGKMCLEAVPIFKDEPEFSGQTSQKIAEEICVMFVYKYADALAVSDIDAKKFLAGEYDDIENISDIEKYISELESAGAELPYFSKYFIQKYYQNELSGPELEVATRILKSQLNELLKIRSESVN